MVGECKPRYFGSVSYGERNKLNPLPHLPILGSSNSAANKDMMSKFGQMGIQLTACIENIVGEISRYKQFLLFPQWFQKQSVVDVLR